MNKIELNIKSPWALLITLSMAVMFLSVIALAEDEEDPVIGYTHDGLPVLESEVPKDAEQYIAKGLRQLDIGVTLQKGLKVNVLNQNTLELFIKDTVYTILLNCVKAGTNKKAVLTPIDFFDWAVAGKIEQNSQVLVTRNPVKNFGNPAIKKMIEKNDVRLSKWDFDPRTCTVVGIQQKLLEDNNGEEN